MNSISVIIPTFHSGDKLNSTLSSLLKQADLLHEIVVVADGKEMHEDIAIVEKLSSPKLKLHVQENKGRAGARNKGAEIASGDILLFLDSDMICGPGLIKDHLAFHAAHADAVLMGGSLRDVNATRTSFDRYLIKIEKRWITDRPAKAKITKENFIFSAANMSMRKSTFQRAGEFDIRLSDSEDFDLGVRLSEMGVPIFYDETILALHNDFPDLDAFIRRLKQYKKAKEELVKRYPDRRAYLREASSKRNTVKAAGISTLNLLFGSFARRNGPLFRALPESIQHYFYRSVIAAAY